MHAGRAWTLDTLAACSGMDRGTLGTVLAWVEVRTLGTLAACSGMDGVHWAL